MPSLQSRLSDSAGRRLVLLVFAIVFLATAWVADDAFISFRTVDNFVSGEGLTWNAGERVQAFTHPLWFFLTAAFYALSGEIYFTTLAICLICSLLAVYFLVVRMASSASVAYFLLAALLLSQGFVDYATSGLENPLSHLLLVLFVLTGWRRESESFRLLPMAAITALIGLNRIDLLAIVGPALALAWIRANGRDRFRALIVTGLPLLAWEVFSLVYFGFLVPNTAPAKLGGGISLLGRITQGFNYFASSLVHDGFTVIFGGWLLIRAFRRPSPFGRSIATGVSLYLVYLLWIGGDVMSGRFLAMPYLLLLTVLIGDLGNIREEIRAPRWVAVILVTLSLRIGASIFGPNVDHAGVGDQRRIWYPFTGLSYALWEDPWPEAAWRIVPGEDCPAESCIVTKDIIGLYGFYSGPEVIIVDEMTLADPFRARLPGRRESDFNLLWRTGWGPSHIARVVPEGFLESLETGENRIVDPDLAEFYGAIRLVTRGPIWSRERWNEIWKVNRGAYRPQIRRWVDRHPEHFRFERRSSPTREDTASPMG